MEIGNGWVLEYRDFVVLHLNVIWNCSWAWTCNSKCRPSRLKSSVRSRSLQTADHRLAREPTVACHHLSVPLQAVCCSDKLHCCPEGYKCDVAAGTCTQNERTMSWDAVYARKDNRVTYHDVKCPGGQVTCPGKETCCQMQSGSYGCCPYEQVCTFKSKVK